MYPAKRTAETKRQHDSESDRTALGPLSQQRKSESLKIKQQSSRQSFLQHHQKKKESFIVYQDADIDGQHKNAVSASSRHKAKRADAEASGDQNTKKVAQMDDPPKSSHLPLPPRRNTMDSLPTPPNKNETVITEDLQNNSTSLGPETDASTRETFSSQETVSSNSDMSISDGVQDGISDIDPDEQDGADEPAQTKQNATLAPSSLSPTLTPHLPAPRSLTGPAKLINPAPATSPSSPTLTPQLPAPRSLAGPAKSTNPAQNALPLPDDDLDELIQWIEAPDEVDDDEYPKYGYVWIREGEPLPKTTEPDELLAVWESD
ncbi:hypothetical protein HDV00_009032 [Rhizophlyctis rosea]|nr:hypothetical protein HDV00_009032 [Rhizophlyctis rosea]